MSQDQIFFFDTTLRDGEQSPGCSMYMAEKVRLAKQLESLGVDVIEAGFAIASEGDFASVRQVAHEVKGPRICSLSRAKEEDIVAAARALEPAAKSRIHIFLASSDIHLEYKLQISREQALELTDKSVRMARNYVDDVEFSPEDASRSDRNFLVEMVQVAVDAGATVINMPDTVGYTVPHEYASMFRLMKDRIRGAENVVYSSHCHNDLGLAVANSLAALEAGARQVECTINGIGERAGNAALEELAAAIHVRHDQLPFRHNLDLKQLYPTSQMLSEVITFAPAPNKAVVGSNAFSHEAGIHQHGVMSNPLCYEIMTPVAGGCSCEQDGSGKAFRTPCAESSPEGIGLQFEPHRSGFGLPAICRSRRPQEICLRSGSGQHYADAFAPVAKPGPARFVRFDRCRCAAGVTQPSHKIAVNR